MRVACDRAPVPSASALLMTGVFPSLRPMQRVEDSDSPRRHRDTEQRSSSCVHFHATLALEKAEAAERSSPREAAGLRGSFPITSVPYAKGEITTEARRRGRVNACPLVRCVEHDVIEQADPHSRDGGRGRKRRDARRRFDGQCSRVETGHQTDGSVKCLSSESLCRGGESFCTAQRIACRFGARCRKR